MKIVLVHNSYQLRGGEDVVFEQETQLLMRAGHDVLTYLRSNSELQGLSGARLLQLAPRTVWARDTHKEFAGLLDREKPDLVHVHNTLAMISPSIFSACQEARVPVVQTLHNYRLYCPGATLFRDGHPCEECIDHSLWRGIAHGCYRNSRLATANVALMLAVHRQRQTWTRDVNCYIALSEFARGKFLKAGLPSQKVFVKPNFVHPDPGMRANGEGDYALFVGRVSSERLRTILAAWSLLPTPRIPLIIVGGGAQLAEFEKEASQRCLAEVRFEGELPRPATLAAMQGARFLVFSSEWYENFPVTIAEAFACGVPVICSRLGAMQEIVEDGRTGFHFSPGDAVDLAEKAQWAWNHPIRMREMGKEARCEYEAKYTSAENYPIMMEIYRHAIGQGRFQSELAINLA